jgi:hypothetical protein
MVQLEVLAASEVEEAYEVQHTMALEQVQSNGTCFGVPAEACTD